MVAIGRVLNVVIPSTHLADAVRFYKEVLGFPVAFEGATYCFVRAGGVNIALHPADPATEFFPRDPSICLDVAVESLA